MTGHFLSCASTNTEGININIGELSPLVSGTRWEYSQEDADSSYYLELNEDGNAIWYDSINNVIVHLTAESTWFRNGKTISISHNAGYRYIEGTLQSGNNPRTIIGAGINGLKKEWKFTMIEI